MPELRLGEAHTAAHPRHGDAVLLAGAANPTLLVDILDAKAVRHFPRRQQNAFQRLLVSSHSWRIARRLESRRPTTIGRHPGHLQFLGGRSGAWWREVHRVRTRWRGRRLNASNLRRTRTATSARAGGSFLFVQVNKHQVGARSPPA